MSAEIKYDPAPYETYDCKGQYMETGKPWAGDDASGESMCMHCGYAMKCWAIKNGKDKKDE